jgi:hypothetical protein
LKWPEERTRGGVKESEKKKKKKLKRKDAGARVCFSPLWFLNLKKKKKKVIIM